MLLFLILFMQGTLSEFKTIENDEISGEINVRCHENYGNM